MITQEITAASLYASDSTFKSLVDIWVAERRCPLPLVDRCLEFDLTSAADCCLWAATAEDGPVFCAISRAGERGGTCGPYPTYGSLSGFGGGWYWESHPQLDGRMKNPHVIPTRHILRADDDHQFFPQRTIPEAILWLIDNWIPQEK